MEKGTKQQLKPGYVLFDVSVNSIIDSKTSIGYGLGVQPMPYSTAIRLADRGKGKFHDQKQQRDYIALKTRNLSDSDLVIPESIPEVSKPVELPADFPEREVLIANGFDTVASLQRFNVKEQLMAIGGMNQAKVTKIGLALEKF